MDKEDGTTVGDILDELKIDRNDVSIMLVNGKDGQFETKLKESDILALFPPVGGG